MGIIGKDNTQILTYFEHDQQLILKTVEYVVRVEHELNEIDRLEIVASF